MTLTTRARTATFWKLAVVLALLSVLPLGYRPAPVHGEVALAQVEKMVFPESDGRETFFELCGGCHDVKDTAKVRRTKKAWQDVVADMQAKGAQGTPDDARAIARYMTRAFGLVNVNKADADELVAVLGISPAEARGMVAWRTANAAFAALDDLKKVAGVNPEAIERVKAAIVFSDK